MPAIPNRGTNTPYFSFQGEVFVAGRRLPDEEDGNGLIAPIDGFQSLGNIPRFDYSLSSDIEIIKDHRSGLRNTDKQNNFGSEVTLDLDLYGISDLAFALAHRGIWSTIAPGAVTNATLIWYSARFGRYIAVDSLPTLFEDYYLGRRGADGNWQPYRNLNLSTLLVKDSTGTPKTLTVGTNFSVFRKTGRIVFKDLTTGGAYTAPIKANTNFGTVEAELPRKITWGLKYPLGYLNVSSLIIKDSAGTPVAVNETYYTVDDDYGTVSFNRATLAAMEAANYVEPLIATFNHGSFRHMSLLTDSLDREYWVRLQGVNTLQNNRPIVVDFYRVKFNEVSNASLIHERTGLLPLKATAIADLRMEPDDIMGQIGQIMMV
jgi:hypothetical protein